MGTPPQGPGHEGGERADVKRLVTFLHGLVNEALQLLGLVVLGLSLQQPSYILQGLFIFLQAKPTYLTSNAPQGATLASPHPGLSFSGPGSSFLLLHSCYSPTPQSRVHKQPSCGG